MLSRRIGSRINHSLRLYLRAQSKDAADVIRAVAVSAPAVRDLL